MANNVFGVFIGGHQIENVNGVIYRGTPVGYYFDNWLSIRSIGVFWEPGLFANWLTFAFLWMQHQMRQFGSIWMSLIFLFALVSTLSIAAVLFFLGCMICRSGAGSGSHTRIIAVLILGIAAIYTLDFSLFSTDYDLSTRWADRFDVSNESNFDRIISIRILTGLISEQPILGVGFSGLFTSWESFGGKSMVFTPLIAWGALGLWSLVLFLPLAIFVLQQGACTRNQVGMLLIIGVMLAKENHLFFASFYLFSFYALRK